MGRSPSRFRIVEIDHLVQLADVGIAIADEVDEGLDIERQPNRLGLDRRLVVRKLLLQ
jgi:hypothetical protein